MLESVKDGFDKFVHPDFDFEMGYDRLVLSDGEIIPAVGVKLHACIRDIPIDIGYSIPYPYIATERARASVRDQGNGEFRVRFH